MKKTLRILCMILILSMLLTPLCYAEDNYDTLADWNLKVKVPEGTTAVLKGSSYYIYADHVGYIPYVMIRAKACESAEKFIDDLTASMQKDYADFEVTSEPFQAHYGDKLCWETDFSYTVSGYTVTDRRIVFQAGELVYMFASKEVEELDMTIGEMLDDVVADCTLLGGSEISGLEEEEDLSLAYVYCLDNGMPKYWLDLSGAMADTIVLHCFFRSGDPTFYETVYYLDLDTADISENKIDIHTVLNEKGIDVSDWFKSLSIRIAGNQMVLTVKRDEKTLAGGTEDNILTGSYKMKGVGVGLNYRYYQEDGMLKYWLDKTGDELRLHAMFRSGEPEFYEEVFILDLDTAEEPDEYSIAFHKVFNEAGFEVSDWFKSLTISEVQDALIMNVKRDEKTLAGGEDDNILTGAYLFEPHTYLLPASSGPYAEKELAQWAQI